MIQFNQTHHKHHITLATVCLAAVAMITIAVFTTACSDCGDAPSNTSSSTTSSSPASSEIAPSVGSSDTANTDTDSSTSSSAAPSADAASSEASSASTSEVSSSSASTAQPTATPAPIPCTLTMMLEGMEEAVSAMRYEKGGYSIAIPMDEWMENASDTWQATNNEKVKFSVLCLAEGDLAKVATSHWGEAGDESSWLEIPARFFDTGDGQTHILFSLGSAQDTYYYMLAECPAEAMEGYGIRMAYIAAHLEIYPA